MGFFSSIAKVFKKVFDVIKSVVEAIIDVVKAAVKWVMDLIVDIFSALGVAGVVILAIIIVVLYFFCPPFAAWLTSVWLTITAWATMIWEAVVYYAGVLWEYLVLVWDWLAGMVSSLGSFLWDAGTMVYEGLATVARGAVSLVKGVGSFIGPAISSLLGFITDNPLLAAGIGAALFGGKSFLKYALIGCAGYVALKLATRPKTTITLAQPISAPESRISRESTYDAQGAPL